MICKKSIFHSFETIFDEKCHNLAVLIIVTFHSGAFTLKFVWFGKVRLSRQKTRNYFEIRRKAPALYFDFRITVCNFLQFERIVLKER